MKTYFLGVVAALIFSVSHAGPPEVVDAVKAAEPAQSAQSAKAGGHGVEPKSVDLDNLALSNQSLNDLFKCMYLLAFHARTIFQDDFSTTHANEADLGKLIARAGNREGWELNLHGRFETRMLGKPGFFVRQGENTYFVEKPTHQDKQYDGFVGSLKIPGRQSLMIVARERRPPFSIASAEKFDPKRDYPLKVTALADNDRNMIENFQKILDEGVQSEVGIHMLSHIFYPNFSKQERLKAAGRFDADDFHTSAEGYVVRIGPPAAVLRRLEACKSAMAPNNKQLINLISGLHKHKVNWETNYEAAKRILHAQKVLGEIKEEARNAQEQNPVPPGDFLFDVTKSGAFR